MTDIAMLFARDPFEMTRKDIDDIILELRTRRKGLGTKPPPEPRAAKTRAPSKKATTLAAMEGKVEVSL